MARARSAVFAAIFASATGFGVALLVTMASAQQQPAQRPRPQAPPKPYQTVATTLPAAVNDQSFEAFRHKLAEVAIRKDKAGLAKLVVAQGFFWKTEKGEKADKNKSGIDNLAAAVGLNAPDASGWDQLVAYAFDQTAAPSAVVKDSVCSPAEPVFNEQEFENLLRATQTYLEDWDYPLLTGIEVRSGPQANAAVIETLGLHFVRVLADENAVNLPPNEAPTIKIVTPSGKIGYVPAFALAPFGTDQLCYRKDADGWKIGGYIGGD
jgi:predicted RecA/RadA family phage recombinase